MLRHCASYQTRVAALWDDGELPLDAITDQSRDLFRTARLDDRERFSAIHSAPVAFELRAVGSIHQDAARWKHVLKLPTYIGYIHRSRVFAWK